MRRYSHGFAIIESILILVVVAILAGAVFFVYRSNKNTSDSLKGVGSGEIVKNKPNDSSSSNGFVTIKEWGVRAPYNGQLSFTYKIDASSDVTTAAFSTKQLASLDPNCKEYGGGTIARLASNDRIDTMEGNPGERISVKEYAERFKREGASGYAGGHYYFFYHDQSKCSDKESVLKFQNEANDVLKSLVPKLEPIPASN